MVNTQERRKEVANIICMIKFFFMACIDYQLLKNIISVTVLVTKTEIGYHYVAIHLLYLVPLMQYFRVFEQ